MWQGELSKYCCHLTCLFKSYRVFAIDSRNKTLWLLFHRSTRLSPLQTNTQRIIHFVSLFDGHVSPLIQFFCCHVEQGRLVGETAASKTLIIRFIFACIMTRLNLVAVTRWQIPFGRGNSFSLVLCVTKNYKLIKFCHIFEFFSPHTKHALSHATSTVFMG